MVNPRTEMSELLEITNCGSRENQGMISIERCREILGKYGKELTNEEIKQIRETLYLFAGIQIDAEEQLIKEELKKEAEGIKSSLLKWE